MPLQIIRQDITKVTCDAIVNAANKTLLGGGGVDGAIHRAAGKGLLKECITLHGCRVGEAKATGAYKLPAKYVIHTVGPKWNGGDNGEEELLRACYRHSLETAMALGCESVAFPLISTGVYGYPMAEGFRVATDEIAAFLKEHDMLVYLVVYGKTAMTVSRERFGEIEEYIDDHYVAAHTDFSAEKSRAVQENMPRGAAFSPSFSMPSLSSKKARRAAEEADTVFEAEKGITPDATEAPFDLDGIDIVIDESFSDMLLRKIDERGMKDSECYKKANIDRKLFSKIRSNPQYKPSKPTVFAFAIALELSLEETKELLMKAGFALSHSYKFDVIVEYFIKKRNYNIFEINEALFAFDQPLLGSN